MRCSKNCQNVTLVMCSHYFLEILTCLEIQNSEQKGKKAEKMVPRGYVYLFKSKFIAIDTDTDTSVVFLG